MTLNAHSGLPEGGKARRVYLLLRDEIANGDFKAGWRACPASRSWPTAVRCLARDTIRRALEALAADGLIEKKTGAAAARRRARPMARRPAAVRAISRR